MPKKSLEKMTWEELNIRAREIDREREALRDEARRVRDRIVEMERPADLSGAHVKAPVAEGRKG